MAALPYIQLYVADYLADTAHLTTEEHGAYLLLIFNYWQRGKPLPNDDDRLARVCRMDVDRFRKIRPMLAEFFDETETEWTQKRIETDLKKVRKTAKIKRENGKKGGRPLKTKDNQHNLQVSGSLADANLKQSYTETDTDTDTKEPPLASPPLETKKPNPKKRATRLRQDWTPTDANYQFAQQQGMTDDAIRLEADKFRDYWISQSDAKAAKLDWCATWRNWIRNSKPSFDGYGARGGRNQAEDVIGAAIRYAARSESQ
jgi:uncharacterized protein YdaU (DUF1376 family)